MAVAIRGTTPAVTTGAGDPTSVSLTGSRQPQANDVLVIIHCNNFYLLSNITTPTVGGSTTGVTPITNGAADSGTNTAHAASWYYVVASTGDLTVAEDESGTADEEKGLIVYVLSGVDTANPIDVAGNAVDTGSTTHNAPSISPSSSDAFLICHATAGNGTVGGYTPPGGMSETYDADVSVFMSLAGAVVQLSASGATGTKTFTPTTARAENAQLSIAVKTGGAAAADSSSYSPARLPGRIGPDGRVFLPLLIGDSAPTVDVTGTVTETQDNQTSTASGVLGYTGTAAVTQANHTSTATGVLGYTGTAAVTQANQTSTGTGVLGYTGTVAETQDNQTSSASGSVAAPGIVGSLAETQDNQTSTAAGVLGYTGTSARTQANQTSTASGTFTPAGISGTAAITQANQTSTATGTLGYTGTSARTQANQTAAAAGWISVTGTAAVTQANQTANGSGVNGAIDPAPLSRTYTVPAYPRVNAIEADTRTHVIPAETRTLIVPAE